MCAQLGKTVARVGCDGAHSVCCAAWRDAQIALIVAPDSLAPIGEESPLSVEPFLSITLIGKDKRFLLWCICLR